MQSSFVGLFLHIKNKFCTRIHTSALQKAPAMMWKRNLLLLMSSFLFSCDVGHDLPSTMSVKEICQVAGKIIKGKMAGSYKVNLKMCKVISAGDNRFEILGDYLSPEESSYQYTARGTLKDRVMLINEISINGVTRGFVPFHNFYLSST